MKEQEFTTSKIKWPNTPVVEVNPMVDFVYIMRKDSEFTIHPIADRVSTDYMLDPLKTKQILLEEYDIFFAQLADILQWGYVSKGNFELHLYDPDMLDKQVRLKAGEMAIVSLDPLMNKGVYEHRVSRGYFLSGKQDFGQVTRPGNPSLDLQAKSTAKATQGLPVSVSEDDIFSGGSVIATLEGLIKQGVNIQKVISGIQVGITEKISNFGVEIDPVVTYKTIDGSDIFDKVDLGDPRDYLIGGSGLVVKLPNGEFARAPYILPFVSTSARAGIPQEKEKDFANKVLAANITFFKDIEEKLGKPLQLKHMDQQFVILMHELFGIDTNTPMQQVAIWALNNIDSVWEFMEKSGEMQKNLESLKLPTKMIFIDVNGTLVPDDAVNGNISEDEKLALIKTVSAIKEKGIAVGLCSDSPVPQLQMFGKQLGIDGPIIGENGNIVFNNGKKLRVRNVPDIELWKSYICFIANKEWGRIQAEDCIAPEFDGKPVDYRFHWSFGANRETSISVFADEDLIKSLENRFEKIAPLSLGIDCSPEHHYFAVHPGFYYKHNKAMTLNLLADYGYQIAMIGNSLSDWTGNNSKVPCAFVGNTNLPEKYLKNAWYKSDKPLAKGVVDILEKII